jgi:hypothetical protein
MNMSKPRRRKVGQGDPALAKEVEAIRKLKERALVRSKQLIADVVEIGKRLTRVKKPVGHGNWGTWLAENFEWSEDSAQRYMRVYRLVAEGKFKFRTLRNLDLSVVYVLAGCENLTDNFINDLTQRVDAGERPTVKQLQVEIGTVTKPLKAPGYVTHYTPPPQPLITRSTTFSPSPAEKEIYKWSNAFHGFLVALVNVGDVDKPTPREFADGVRACPALARRFSSAAMSFRSLARSMSATGSNSPGSTSLSPTLPPTRTLSAATMLVVSVAASRAASNSAMWVLRSAISRSLAAPSSLRLTTLSRRVGLSLFGRSGSTAAFHFRSTALG